MSRKCVITKKGPLSGNNVSHAKNKTRTKWNVNMKSKRVFDTASGKWVRIKLSARALRTISKKGFQKAMKDALT